MAVEYASWSPRVPVRPGIRPAGTKRSVLPPGMVSCRSVWAATSRPPITASPSPRRPPEETVARVGTDRKGVWAVRGARRRPEAPRGLTARPRTGQRGPDPVSLRQSQPATVAPTRPTTRRCPSWPGRASASTMRSSVMPSRTGPTTGTTWHSGPGPAGRGRGRTEGLTGAVARLDDVVILLCQGCEVTAARAGGCPARTVRCPGHGHTVSVGPISGRCPWQPRGWRCVVAAR